MSSQAERYLSGEQDTAWAAGRRQVAVGVPDRALTPNAGLAAVTGLCDRLGVIGALDAAVGPVKQRDRGFGAGQLLTARPGTRGKERPGRPGQAAQRA